MYLYNSSWLIWGLGFLERLRSHARMCSIFLLHTPDVTPGLLYAYMHAHLDHLLSSDQPLTNSWSSLYLNTCVAQYNQLVSAYLAYQSRQRQTSIIWNVHMLATFVHKGNMLRCCNAKLEEVGPLSWGTEVVGWQLLIKYNFVKSNFFLFKILLYTLTRLFL